MDKHPRYTQDETDSFGPSLRFLLSFFAHHVCVCWDALAWKSGRGIRQSFFYRCGYVSDGPVGIVLSTPTANANGAGCVAFVCNVVWACGQHPPAANLFPVPPPSAS